MMISIHICHNGCISDTYAYVHMVLQFQKIIFLPCVTIAIFAVGRVVYRSLKANHSLELALKYIIAVGVCAGLEATHSALNLSTLSAHFVPRSFLWNFFTDVQGSQDSERTAFLMWTFSLCAMVPLTILHHINTGQRKTPLFKYSSSESNLKPLFETLIISPEGDEDTDCHEDSEYHDPHNKEGRRATVMQEFKEEPSQLLVHQQRPIRGKHVFKLGTHAVGNQHRRGYNLTLSDAVGPSHITFQCTAAYLEFRLQECNQWSRSSMARWDKAVGILQESSRSEQSSPSLGFAMRSLQEDAAFRDLSSWRSEHLKSWSEHLQHLKDMLLANQRWCDLDRNQHHFKPSVAKNAYLTAATATNLQNYSVIAEDVELGTTKQSLCQFNITTVGAFAAHSLAGKNLITLSEEMEICTQKLATETSLRAPAEELLNLEMQIATLRGKLEYRTTVALGQALSAAVNTLLESVRECFRCEREAEVVQWCEIGYLFQMQSLLSTQGNETSMLQDMRYAMNLLRDVSVLFHSEANGGWQVTRDQAELGLASGGLVLRVPIPAQEADWLEHLQLLRVPIQFVPCLFTLGVNEMQSIANVIPGIGDPLVQTKVNQQGFADLRAYWTAFGEAKSQPELLPWMDLSESFAVTETQRERAQWEAEETQNSEKLSMWQSLQALVAKHEPNEKDVQLLVDSAMLCRAMHGGRATCCKSAKDRTSMAVSLEVAVLVAAKGLLGDEPFMREEEIRNILTSLRGDAGVRLQNCKLNTGKKMYAFNKFQQRTLPDLLKPPPEFAGSCVS
eukprot:TRINITY_DN12826_c0_g2_i1.p1 TRINITY_DN12826_c0_g2~~TRINITY_DN12826_c0_g2_i1.p1  ORF type:complete len:788 (-),score=158.25 TRINITY_DN12826_c0_g2_i1:230-2593(-)